VALCFSGQPRFVQQTLSYWRNCIINKYQTDVFVHCWIDDHRDSHIPIILDAYQPKAFQYEPPITFDVSSYQDRIWPHRTTPQNVLSQYQGWYQCQQLRQQAEQAGSFKYDIVVRARFDWFLESVDFEINNCVNVAHTPGLNSHHFWFDGQPHLGINDQFAYGNSRVITHVGDLILHVHKLYHQHRVDFCSELLLKAHLLSLGIDHKEHHWRNGIVRSWGVMP
jgi:hypothetical protein